MKSLTILIYLSCVLCHLIIPVICDGQTVKNVADTQEGLVSDALASPSASNDTARPELKDKIISTIIANNRDAQGDSQISTDCHSPQYNASRVHCSGQSWNSMPDFSKFQRLYELKMDNNTIDRLEVDKLPPNILYLDLSNNQIKRFVPSKARNPPGLQLKTLILSSNGIESLSNFSSLRFNQLESLDLSNNPLVGLGKDVLNDCKKLKKLNIASTGLKMIHELAFTNLTELRTLNMSHVRLSTYDLGHKFLANNQRLETIDLTDNALLEVPHILRSASSLKNLILDQNLMTSLRPSDFSYKTSLTTLSITHCPKLVSVDDGAFAKLFNLKNLFLTDNPNLKYISKDAFNSDESHILDILDLSDNGIAWIPDLSHFTSLKFKTVELRGNPWNCSCSLSWLLSPALSGSPLHCKYPSEFRDMEISTFFHSTDCEAEENPYHKTILTLFLLFLLGLTVAVFVQKTDLCRKFFAKEQYGTIYYTKASFQPDNTIKTEMT